jgi:hypothetical protein
VCNSNHFSRVLCATAGDGGEDHAAFFLHHGSQLQLHLLRPLDLAQQLLLGVLQLQDPLQLLLLPLHPSLHVLPTCLLQLPQSHPPKLVDILLRLDLDQSHLIPFLGLEHGLAVVLLTDELLVESPLPLDVAEEAVVGLAEL